MYPHYPQPQQQGPYPPLQSRGFQPPPQVRPSLQPAFPHPTQPPVPSHVQQYQSNPQYRQPPLGHHYGQPQKPHDFSGRQEYKHTPSPPATSLPPQPGPHQAYYPTAAPQSYTPSVPFNSYPQRPVAPPMRRNSQSPEKARPLPTPTASGASQRFSTPPNVPPTASHVHPTQPQILPFAPLPGKMPVYPAASSISSPPASQSFPQGQPFQPRTSFPPQRQPQAMHTGPLRSTTGFPPSQEVVNGTPPTPPTRSPSPSKRPLPMLPSGSASPSPPGTLGRASTLGTVVLGPAVPRREIPHSPATPPDTEMARNNRFRSPQRSSTLPNLHGSVSQGVAAYESKDDIREPSVMHQESARDAHTDSQAVEASLPKGSSTFALPPSVGSKASAGFSLPQQDRKPTQSLTLRLATLSLQEERSRTRFEDHFSRQASQISGAPPGSSHAVSFSRYPLSSSIDLDDAPPTSAMRQRSPSDSKRASRSPASASPPSIPTINVSISEPPSTENSTVPSVKASKLPSTALIESPSIIVDGVPAITVQESPGVNASENGPSIMVSEATPRIAVSELPEISASSTSSSIPDIIVADLEGTLETSVNAPTRGRKGLICYGCGKGIIGRIVSAMGGRWHPSCFKCTVCGELLEHVSSYEHGGKPYCHLDYHEKFAPQCYHCRTPIIDERFITVDDPGLGKRTYHEQHFFCAECGDPFLTPSLPGKREETDAAGTVMQDDDDDDVGFTVYKGHAYCEACHVRLRYPKCKRCKKSILDGARAVEALGGKWCWECFLCAGCEKPFDDLAFFERDKNAYCEACFSVIIKSEM